MNLFTAALVISAPIIFATESLAAEYDRVAIELDRLASTYHNYVDAMDLGQNDQGMMIRGITVQHPTRQSIAQPHHLVVGTHHGNERMSADLALKFANDLIRELQSPTESAWEVLRETKITIVPVLNIGGFNGNRRQERDGSGRSLDPNRDYPDPCRSSSHFQLKSTTGLAKFVYDENIIGAVTIHGYIGTFTFPWGTYTAQTHTHDHAQYMMWAQKAKDRNQYRIGTHTDLIYPAAGAFEDWAYHKYGIWVSLIELDRGANLAKDSAALLSYLSALPDQRSTQHDHMGPCTRLDQLWPLTRP